MYSYFILLLLYGIAEAQTQCDGFIRPPLFGGLQTSVFGSLSETLVPVKNTPSYWCFWNWKIPLEEISPPKQGFFHLLGLNSIVFLFKDYIYFIFLLTNYSGQEGFFNVLCHTGNGTSIFCKSSSSELISVSWGSELLPLLLFSYHPLLVPVTPITKASVLFPSQFLSVTLVLGCYLCLGLIPQIVNSSTLFSLKSSSKDHLISNTFLTFLMNTKNKIATPPSP